MYIDLKRASFRREPLYYLNECATRLDIDYDLLVGYFRSGCHHTNAPKPVFKTNVLNKGQYRLSEIRVWMKAEGFL